MNLKKIILKNLPNNFDDLQTFFQTHYGAKAAKRYGRRRAILEFVDEGVAIAALHSLHQCQIQNRVISAEFLGTRQEEPPEEPDKQPENESYKLPAFVKQLYATSIEHGFDQPPPPHLRYYYPKIDRNILDSICIALMSEPKFYYQVVHLMNRMNLEPPFLPRAAPFIPPGELVNKGTQTDFKAQKSKLASDESELESDEESREGYRVTTKRQRLNDGTVLKKKAKQILHSKHIERAIPTKQKLSSYDLKTFFETNESLNVHPKICLNVSDVILKEKPLHENKEEKETPIPEEMPLKVGANIFLEDLSTNRFSEEQLKTLPVYKNYQRGERSNKLYIKNLSKEVEEADLELIYNRYVKDTDKTIEIKLMKFGKMKGQAFITFNAEDSHSSSHLDLVEQALNETNGYILKDKPMIVCFGKRT